MKRQNAVQPVGKVRFTRFFVQHPALAGLLLALVYLLGLALGLAAGAYPIYRKQQPLLMMQARDLALQYAREECSFCQAPAGLLLRVLVYDGTGVRVAQQLPQRVWETDFDALLRPYQAVVQNGGELFTLIPAQKAPRNLTEVWFLMGVPIPAETQPAGTLFLIKNVENIQEALIGFFLCYTLFYWLSVVFFLSSRRNQRRLDALRQNYVDNVTHALKTPIASIKALAEALCDGVAPDPDQQNVYHGMILREANRQSQMVRSILELSKLQNGGFDFTRSPVQPKEIFDPILEKYTMLCDCSGIRFRGPEQHAALPTLDTNANCVREILEILLDNALKFTEEGGNIRLTMEGRRNHAVICVSDNGPGIAPADLPRIFERFYRGSPTPAQSGNGLGLAIAREIADGLKERLWVESAPGAGTKFYFTVRTHPQPFP